MPKKVEKKTAAKKQSGKSSLKFHAKRHREHRGLVGALILFVGFSTYSMISIMDSNNDYLRYYSDVLKTSVTNTVAPVEEEETIEELPFVDVSVEHKNYEAIRELYFRGVVSGYSDGKFKPQVVINRAEFAKFLVEATDKDITAIPADQLAYCATDVTDLPDQWFPPFVCGAKYSGWVNGYDDGSYGPGKQINRAEAAKIVLSAFGFEIPAAEDVEEFAYPDLKEGDWFLGVAEAVKELSLLGEVETFDAATAVTRGDTAQMIFNALKLQAGE